MDEIRAGKGSNFYSFGRKALLEITIPLDIECKAGSGGTTRISGWGVYFVNWLGLSGGGH